MFFLLCSVIISSKPQHQRKLLIHTHRHTHKKINNDNKNEIITTYRIHKYNIDLYKNFEKLYERVASLSLASIG